jgi:hypothetical protein
MFWETLPPISCYYGDLATVEWRSPTVPPQVILRPIDKFLDVLDANDLTSGTDWMVQNRNKIA